MMSVRGSKILATLILLISASHAFAVKMDETTHDEIIKRLEMGISGMEKSEPERPAILLRLADLYADRGRLKAMNEMDQNCTTCKGAREDRKQAVALYNEALPKTAKDQQGPIILQIAHLYALNDEGKKSQDLYQSVLKAKKGVYASEVKAIANANVGEIYFRKGDFKTALKYLEAARRENLKTRAIVEYRIAWCQLNLGQSQKAINTLVRLLKDPNLLATQTTDGKTVDPTFVQDASNDLAKFLARSKVSVRDINLLKSLSPDKARKGNLYTLATESDRLGKKQEALVVWAAYVDEGDVQPQEKLEVQIRVARIFYDQGKQDVAANAYEKATELWRKNGCQGDKCDELKAKLRNLVTAWNKGQKDKPQPGLFRSYVAYTNTFPDDLEMMQWAAIVGKELGKHKEAADLFHKSALLAQAELAKKPNDKQLKSVLEGSLLGEIEMAEGSGDLKTRENAYNFYLQINPNGAEAFNVRYQRAQVYYKTNRFQEAFSEFHYLASQPGKDNRDLKIKSADLALDSLVALKDDQSLQVRSLEYARLFPERKDEYLKISRKASMNIVAAKLKNEKENDRTDYKASLATLEKVSMEGADDAEKIKFYKNKITVAQKALVLDAVNVACNQLLLVKSLSKQDHQWTMEQKVWVAELQLNFREAYKLSTEMDFPNLSKADRELRLALLAELAGQSAREHNLKYLKLSSNVRSSNLVRVSLIKDSSSPWRELDKQLSELKKTPDLLAGIALETYARQSDNKHAERLLHTTRIAQYPAGQTLSRHLELRDFHSFDHKIASHRIYGHSDMAMQKSIKERLKLLGQSERRAQQSIAKHDWTLQILALTELARENRRLYHDILQLPTPARLNAADKKKYAALLHAQSAPYLARAEKIEDELSRMWDSNSVQNLQATYMTSSAELQKLYRDEIKDLAQNAPANAKNRLQNLLNTPFRHPSQKDLMNARRDLQANPFDVSKAENLRQLEQQNNHPAMVAYLDERISQLKQGKSL
jgi:hypothetical protein